MTNIEWLWFDTSGSTDVQNGDPYSDELNFDGVLKKLTKHGYALMLNRMETGKIQAVRLAVHDALGRAENPKIVIICSEHLIKSWYSTLLWDMGVEFKYFGVFEKSANLFSDKMANLCLVSTESLMRDGDKSVLGDSKIIWDLMIIDMPIDDKTGLKTYSTAIKSKSERLLISASASAEYGAEYANITELVKTLLQRGKKDSAPGGFTVKFGDGQSDTPVIAGRNKAGDYNVKTIKYKLDNALMSKARRIDGVSYKFGGNIFEEYALDLRKAYRADEYSTKHLKALAMADTKMKAFLAELNVVLEENPENRVVVYCSASGTVNYLAKVLKARYGDKKTVCVYNIMTDADYINSEFSCKSANEPHIIIADDRAGVRFLNIEKLTHIINYEYPENPAILEQRYTRGGRKAASGTGPEFSVFCDEDCKYDGRMLRKILLNNFSKAFCAGVADKSLLFNIEGIEEHLITLILDLKFISDNPKEAGEDFAFEYGLPENLQPKAIGEAAKNMLKKLGELFEIAEILDKKEIDGERLFTQLMQKTDEFKNKRVYLEGNKTLKLAKDPAANPPTAKKPPEVEKAVAFAATLTGEAADYPRIVDETAKLSDSKRLSALMSVWKHYRYNMKSPRTYREFMLNL
ncbi:MAG: hypothetical protein FWH20_08365 [Oscillospiraceae bacterium]|nr:hypothetical protein [Oscillospiraceae bacterium]